MPQKVQYPAWANLLQYMDNMLDIYPEWTDNSLIYLKYLTTHHSVSMVIRFRKFN